MIKSVPFRRLLSLLIDAMFVYGTLFLLDHFLKLKYSISDYITFAGPVAVLYLGISYPVLKGKSLGLLFVKLRVLNIDGKKLSVGKYMLYGVIMSQLLVPYKWNLIFTIIILFELIFTKESKELIMIERMAGIFIKDEK